MTVEATQPARSLSVRSLPPITETAVGSLVLIVTGAIFLSANVFSNPPLWIPWILLVAAAALLAFNIVQLTRLNNFAWDSFVQVGLWTLLAYVIIAGMLEYVFVVDGTPGSRLLILTLMLLVFAVDIPLILAFSVARYQPAKR
jgi:CDP-diglyceride synthetase